LSAEPRSVGIARDACTALLERLDVQTECIEMLKLAVAEACANVVEHACDPTDLYEVRIDVVGGWCHVGVIDHGRGFDTRALTYEMPSAPSARGRGLAIMRRVVDDVVVSSLAGGGTRVLLSKQLVFDESLVAV
jgi:serine/threonine-protein kinase RsbW